MLDDVSTPGTSIVAPLAADPRTVVPANSAGAVTVTTLAQTAKAINDFRPGTPARRTEGTVVSAASRSATAAAANSATKSKTGMPTPPAMSATPAGAMPASARHRGHHDGRHSASAVTAS